LEDGLLIFLVSPGLRLLHEDLPPSGVFKHQALAKLLVIQSNYIFKQRVNLQVYLTLEQPLYLATMDSRALSRWFMNDSWT
jgi:hypothetical protein